MSLAISTFWVCGFDNRNCSAKRACWKEDDDIFTRVIEDAGGAVAAGAALIDAAGAVVAAGAALIVLAGAPAPPIVAGVSKKMNKMQSVRGGRIKIQSVRGGLF